MLHQLSPIRKSHSTHAVQCRHTTCPHTGAATSHHHVGGFSRNSSISSYGQNLCLGNIARQRVRTSPDGSITQTSSRHPRPSDNRISSDAFKSVSGSEYPQTINRDDFFRRAAARSQIRLHGCSSIFLSQYGSIIAKPLCDRYPGSLSKSDQFSCRTLNTS